MSEEKPKKAGLTITEIVNLARRTYASSEDMSVLVGEVIRLRLKLARVSGKKSDAFTTVSNHLIANAARQLFDNRLGHNEKRAPYAPPYFWANLGAALYGELDPRVKELRDQGEVASSAVSVTPFTPHEPRYLLRLQTDEGLVYWNEYTRQWGSRDEGTRYFGQSIIEKTIDLLEARRDHSHMWRSAELVRENVDDDGPPLDHVPVTLDAQPPSARAAQPESPLPEDAALDEDPEPFV